MKRNFLQSFWLNYWIPLLVLAAFVVATGVFLVAFGVPVVAVVSFSGELTEGNVRPLQRALSEVGENRAVKAVVVDLSSPGGSASTVEELYLQVLRVREEKPVVVSVGDRATSGAYYLSVAANEIFAKPSSTVGNVGVIASFPDEKEDSKVVTGPFKVTGHERSDFPVKVQLIEENFLNAVVLQRGDRLALRREEVAKSKVYLGVEALGVGLVDRIGPVAEAVERAAELGKLRNFRVERVSSEGKE